jgi:hypothetical protein
VVDLFLGHDDREDGAVFLAFLLLFADGVQQFLLVVLVFVLQIFQFLQVGHVLVLYLFETQLHLVHFLVQGFVVLLDVQ